MADQTPNPENQMQMAPKANLVTPSLNPALSPQMDTNTGTTNASIPVQLTLQVGSVSMELGKLLELDAGTILTNEVISFFPKVRVLASDRAVAEGDLVQVEGKVGLRISKLLG
jgi:flagellar motor switch/type III secretory pathway protein FliN